MIRTFVSIVSWTFIATIVISDGLVSSIVTFFVAYEVFEYHSLFISKIKIYLRTLKTDSKTLVIFKLPNVSYDAPVTSLLEYFTIFLNCPPISVAIKFFYVLVWKSSFVLEFIYN